MTEPEESDAGSSFFESRRFRAGIVLVLLLATLLVPPWWSPLWGGGDSGPEVEITVTPEGLEVSVPEDDANVDAEVTCMYLFTSEVGDTKSEVVTISNGTTQVIDVAGAYPEGLDITYTISCHVGDDVVFDSGSINTDTE